MKINRIVTSGLELLWKGFKQAEDDNRSIAFGCNLPKVLNHVNINLEIENVTGTELLYLKDFSSKVTILSKMIHNNVNQSNSFDLHQQVEKLINLHNQMVSDDDIDKNESDIMNILPLGSMNYKVLVEFTGNSIFSITGAFVNSIFIDSETGHIYNIYPFTKIIENKILDLFYNNFYKFIFSKMNEADYISEFMMINNFYKYSDDIVNLANVSTPHGKIDFFGKNSESLTSDIDNIKNNLKSAPYYLDKSIKLTFVLRTTISVFTNIYMNSNFISHHQNFNTLLNDEAFINNKDDNLIFKNTSLKISDTIISKYSNRIIEPVNYITSYRKSLNNISNEDNSNKTFELLKYNYFLNGNLISYCIQLPLNEIKNFINTLPKNDEFDNIKTEIERNVKIIKNILE